MHETVGLLDDSLPVRFCKPYCRLDKITCFTAPQILCEPEAANAARQLSFSLSVSIQLESVFSGFEEGQATFYLRGMLLYVIGTDCVTYCSSCEGKSADLRGGCLFARCNLAEVKRKDL